MTLESSAAGASDAKATVTEIQSKGKSDNTSQRLLDESRKTPNPADYSKSASAELERQGVLPAIALDYAKTHIADLDKSGDHKLDLTEVRAAEQKYGKDSMEYALLKKVDDLIVNGTLREGDITAETLAAKEKEIDTGDKSRFAKNAVSVLQEKALFDAVDVAGQHQGGRGGVVKPDGVIGQTDIVNYLASPAGQKLEQAKREKLDYLAKHWNDAEVRPLLEQHTADPNSIRAKIGLHDPDSNSLWLSRESVTAGSPKVDESGKNNGVTGNNERVRIVNNEEKKQSGNQADSVSEFADGHTLSVEYKPGTKELLNATEGIRQPDGQMLYVGWRFNTQANEGQGQWIAYNGSTPIATADGISIENGRAVPKNPKYVMPAGYDT